MKKELEKKEPKKIEIDKFYEVLEIIQRQGISVLDGVKKVDDISLTGFYKVLNSNQIYQVDYTRACELRGYLLAEKAVQIFDDVPDIINVDGRMEQNNIGLNKAKAKADALKWYASKLCKALSDKPDTQINIASNEANFNIQIGDKSLDLTK